MRSFREMQNDARVLAQMKATLRSKRSAGSRYVDGASANEVFYCPVCSGPVVRSRDGIRGHMQRVPRCRTAMEKLLV